MARYVFDEPAPVSWLIDYESYWKARSPEAGVSYPEILPACLALLPEGCRILDVGCGDGALLAALQREKHARGVGIDISERAVGLARERGVDARILNLATAAREEIAALGHFDVITCFEVLEHIPDPARLLLRLHEAFSGSRLLLSAPNTGFLPARLRLLFGRFPRQWIFCPYEHINFWTLRDFQRMAHALGYRILSLTPLGGAVSLRNRWPSLFAESLIYELMAQKPS